MADNQHPWPMRGDYVVAAGDDFLSVVDEVVNGTADCKTCGYIHRDYRTRRIGTHTTVRTTGCVVLPAALTLEALAS
jgi:hypothetical protein